MNHIASMCASQISQKSIPAYLWLQLPWKGERNTIFARVDGYPSCSQTWPTTPCFFSRRNLDGDRVLSSSDFTALAVVTYIHRAALPTLCIRGWGCHVRGCVCSCSYGGGGGAGATSSLDNKSFSWICNNVKTCIFLANASSKELLITIMHIL